MLTPVPPRELQALQSSPPTATVLQVSPPAHIPHPEACAPCSLTCLSLYLAWQRLRFWVCPSLKLLVSVWLKRAMPTEGARGKESIHVTTFRVGKILKWIVPLIFLPPSLPIARCPWFCNWVEEKGDEVIEVHSHCTQGCSCLSSCLQGNITPSDNRRQREADKWMGEEWEVEGKEERERGGKQGEGGRDYGKKIRLFPG